MEPRTVVILLVLILSTTLYQYMFFIPDSIANDALKANDRIGYWSPSNADFDWCESNYIFSPLIAELYNSATSLIYIVVAVLSMSAAKKHLPPSIYMRDFLFLNVLLIFVGIGSTLFHATLLYRTQMLDEIPMNWLALYASVMLYTRHKHRRELKVPLTVACALFCASIDVVSWLTLKEGVLHQATKMVMALSFLSGFVYVFYVSAKLGNEVLAKEPDNAEHRRINRYFDKAFFAFTVALMGWLCDNVYCESLQNLVVWGVRIPYLQYHAVLWHGGTCIGLYYLLMLMLAHRVIFEYQMRPKCITIMAGILPYITVVDKDKVH